MSLCKYKDILGIPGEGVHSYRLFGVAIIDVIFTIIGAFLITYFFKIKLIYTIPFLFILGIILHKLFCVKTIINNLLFENL